MLKRRIIPLQLLREGRLVKSVCFNNFRDVCDPVKSSAVYNSQQADELILLNIPTHKISIQPIADLIHRVSEECFMPLTVGGGIRSFEDAAFLIRNGADRVVINSLAYSNPKIISQIANQFGSQAVVVSIDAKRYEDSFCLLSLGATRPEKINLIDHIKICEAAGAGEFLIQSVDKDGTMDGFDIQLLSQVCSTATVPVIGCGGAGNYNHIKDAFLNSEVSGIACGSIFNFTDSNPMRAKSFLSNYGLFFKVV